MIAIGLLFLRMLRDCFKSPQRLEAEILVLRHQLNVLQQRTPRRGLHLRWVDRALFIWLYRRRPCIVDSITIVRPETVVRWHRKGFAAYWRSHGDPLPGWACETGGQWLHEIKHMAFGLLLGKRARECGSA
jgi:hypothetical protein